MPPEAAEIGGQDHGHLSAQSITNQRTVASTTEWTEYGTLFHDAWDRKLVGMYGRGRGISDKRFNDGGGKLDDALGTLRPVLPLCKEGLATCYGRSR